MISSPSSPMFLWVSSTQASSRALHGQPQVLGGTGPLPGQSPNLHLTPWEKAFFPLDLTLLGCGLEWRLWSPWTQQLEGSGWVQAWTDN